MIAPADPARQSMEQFSNIAARITQRLRHASCVHLCKVAEQGLVKVVYV